MKNLIERILISLFIGRFRGRAKVLFLDLLSTGPSLF